MFTRFYLRFSFGIIRRVKFDSTGTVEIWLFLPLPSFEILREGPQQHTHAHTQNKSVAAAGTEKFPRKMNPRAAIDRLNRTGALLERK